jgi:hypothetical protein
MKSLQFSLLALFVAALMWLASPVAMAAPDAGTTPTGSPSPAASPSADAAPTRRAPPQPMDSVFPINEYFGPTIGVPADSTQWPLMKALGLDGDKVAAGLKVYGWFDPGVSFSTSKHSNYPQTYSIVPNMPELDQLVLNIERDPDTVQKDHVDWGFLFTSLYGIDYRWTSAKGWLSDQLLKHNNLYGYDPVCLYGQVYFPKVADGLLMTVGRYISPPDIEAQLAPQNIMFTHSVMFDFDSYTHTGIMFEVKAGPQWSVEVGLQAGNDTAPWAAGSHFTGEAYGRWVSKDNNDSVFFGVDAMNEGQFTGFKDNLQQFNATWTHKFNDKINTMTELYELYSFNALQGGTVSFGPVHPFGPFGGGPGKLLPGISTATGFVNYTNIKIDDKSYISFRTDAMSDPRGWRSGFPNQYGSLTFAYVRHFTDTCTVRPEIRWEHAFNTPAYDNGTKRSQATFGFDVIQRF